MEMGLNLFHLAVLHSSVQGDERVAVASRPWPITSHKFTWSTTGILGTCARFSQQKHLRVRLNFCEHGLFQENRRQGMSGGAFEIITSRRGNSYFTKITGIQMLDAPASTVHHGRWRALYLIKQHWLKMGDDSCYSSPTLAGGGFEHLQQQRRRSQSDIEREVKLYRPKTTIGCTDIWRHYTRPFSPHHRLVTSAEYGRHETVPAWKGWTTCWFERALWMYDGLTDDLTTNVRYMKNNSTANTKLLTSIGN